MSTRSGFTLPEAAIAVGIGVLLLSIAAATFSVTRRALSGIEGGAARTQVLQSAILWSLVRPQRPDAFPTGPMVRQMGTAAWTYTTPAPALGHEHYHVVTLRSYAVPAADVGTFYLPITRDLP